MKRLFHLIVAAVFATAFLAGCQKYDDSDLRKQLQELREKLSSLEAWCSSSQSAIDAVAVLQKAVENMNSVESIDPFIDADGATGYVITFTDKQTIKLYNGEDGEAFFGNVVVNDDCIVFTLADGREFTVPRKQDEHNYLAFEAVEAGATVSLEIIGEVDAPSLEYSTNKLDWTDFDFSNPQTITLKNTGDRVYWRNTGKATTFSKDNSNYVHFILGDRKIAAFGNVMSLIDSSCVSLTIPSDNCFIKLFLNATSLEKAPELPAEDLAKRCYMSMFMGCSSLKDAPDLETVELVDSCYFQMFANCKSLEKAPELPATKMAAYCYYLMFRGCESLKEAPELPSTELARGCYMGMFSYCTSLVKAPELPATDLPRHCYNCMFDSCTSLTDAPDILATKVGYASCFSMFVDCTSLKKAPALPAKQLDEFCYQQMFYNCTSLEEAPELPASELARVCYDNMFLCCSALKKAPELRATKMEENCYFEMFALCTSLEEAPELPSKELAPACYAMMFAGCETLKEAPELPATELAEICYAEMFSDCYLLKEAPELPATKLEEQCYYCMFNRCFSLAEAPELPAMELAPYCYQYMFSECYELETAPELPATTLVEGCYEGIFDCCSNLNHIKVAFDDWNDSIATAGWVAGVGTEGTFECPEGLAVQYGDSFIPNGWSVNGAAPTATKSYAASSIKSISNYSKLLAPKTPKIQIRPVEREKIML